MRIRVTLPFIAPEWPLIHRPASLDSNQRRQFAVRHIANALDFFQILRASIGPTFHDALRHGWPDAG